MPNRIEQLIGYFGKGIDVARGYLDRVKAKRDKERYWQELDAYFMADEKAVALMGSLKRVGSYMTVVEEIGRFWQENFTRFTSPESDVAYDAGDFLTWLRERTWIPRNYEVSAFWTNATSGEAITEDFAKNLFDSMRQIYEVKTDPRHKRWELRFSPDLGGTFLNIFEWMYPDLYSQLQLSAPKVMDWFISCLKTARSPFFSEITCVRLIELARIHCPGGGIIHYGMNPDRVEPFPEPES